MDVTIKIKENKARIFGDVPMEILYRLDNILSYKPRGIEFSPSVVAGRWDGRFRLLNKNLEFPVGLVERVKKFFVSENYNVSIEDLNNYINFNSFDITERLKELGKPPREYQLRAAKIALEKKRGIIKVATGGGKTLISSLVVAGAGGKAVILVIGKDLLYQFHSFFEEVFQQEIGLVGDGICNIKDITIASIWTVGQSLGAKGKLDDELPKEKRLDKNYFKDIRDMIYGANLILMDECHLAAANTVQAIGKAVNSQYSIGMSATPYRSDDCELLIYSIFGEIIVNISASELIDKGFLVKPIIRFIRVPKIIGAGNTYRKIYKNYIVENEVRNNMVTKAAIRLVEQGFVTLVLFKEINHGNVLYDMFKSKGYDPIFLTGKMKSKVRKEGIEKVRNGENNLILASTILDQGIDIQRLSALVLAGSGKSYRAMQRIGRCLRIFPDKEIAAVIDYIDDCRYLSSHAKEREKLYREEDGFEVEIR